MLLEKLKQEMNNIIEINFTEKSIQDKIEDIFKQIKHITYINKDEYKIGDKYLYEIEQINNGKYKNIENELDGYILLDELKNSLEKINKNIINNYIDKNIEEFKINYPNLKTKEEIFNYIINKIINNIITIYKQEVLEEINPNKKIINLYRKLIVKKFVNKLYIKILKDKPLYYNLFDLNNLKSSLNKITIIREQRLKILDNKYQKPDFAIYINGLPFSVIEVKNYLNTAGIEAAKQDYKNKTSYHNFLGAILTNGIETTITSNPNSSIHFSWLNYHLDNDIKNGLIDLIDELIIKKNLLFYYLYSTMLSENETYLKNGRVQQYYVAKYFYENIAFDNSNKKRYFFEHAQRTGKTFTFKLLSHISLNGIKNNKRSNFNKIIITSPNKKSVAPSISKEFINYSLEDYKELYKFYDLTLPHSSINYKDLVNKRENGIFLLNMQKIKKDIKKQNKNNDILIIVDEAHTFQNYKEEDKEIFNFQSFAKIRDNHFPEATFIAATATPAIDIKKTNKDKKIINITKQNFGNSIDQLTTQDAIEKLGIVLDKSFMSVFYKDINNFFKQDKELNKEFDKEFLNIFYQKVKEQESILKKYNIVINNYKNFLEILNNCQNEEVLKFLKDIEQQLNKKITSFKTNKIAEKLIKYKLDYILKIYKDINNKHEYNIKSFWIVNNQKQALKIMEYINNINSENIINNIKFGIDISSYEKETKKLNGNLGKCKDITEVFEIENIEEENIKNIKKVDILIVVNKKLTGYDNKNLTLLFLDKKVGSLTEMAQLVTRPTTQRKGKYLGYIYDLTLTRENEKTYTESLFLYNMKEEERILKNFNIDINKLITYEKQIEEFYNKYYKDLENYYKDLLESKNKDILKESGIEHIAIKFNKLKNVIPQGIRTKLYNENKLENYKKIRQILLKIKNLSNKYNIKCKLDLKDIEFEYILKMVDNLNLKPISEEEINLIQDNSMLYKKEGNIPLNQKITFNNKKNIINNKIKEKIVKNILLEDIIKESLQGINNYKNLLNEKNYFKWINILENKLKEEIKFKQNDIIKNKTKEEIINDIYNLSKNLIKKTFNDNFNYKYLDFIHNKYYLKIIEHPNYKQYLEYLY